MNSDWLWIIVVINTIAIIALWRRKPDRLNKKAAKLLWRSDPITPKHEPPDFPTSFDNDYDRRFFADFKDFADVVNWWLADEYVGSRWRLQDLPDTDRRMVDHRAGPVFGRRFAIFYNQTRLGELEISPAHRYSAEAPQVYTSMEIDWVRMLSFSIIRDFLAAIAMHVTDPRPNSTEAIAARQHILSALIEVLWNNYRLSENKDLDGQDWGEVALNFQGSAEWYIDRKNAWWQNRGAIGG
jgi:hypothetical protein